MQHLIRTLHISVKQKLFMAHNSHCELAICLVPYYVSILFVYLAHYPPNNIAVSKKIQTSHLIIICAEEENTPRKNISYLKLRFFFINRVQINTVHLTIKYCAEADKHLLVSSISHTHTQNANISTRKLIKSFRHCTNYVVRLTNLMNLNKTSRFSWLFRFSLTLLFKDTIFFLM